jgi:hypothetical protein
MPCETIEAVFGNEVAQNVAAKFNIEFTSKQTGTAVCAGEAQGITVHGQQLDLFK